MRPRTFSVLCMLTAMFLIIAWASQVFIDQYIRPKSAFAYLVVSTILTGILSLAINVDVPA
jgi:hypothetical protein